MTPFLVLPLCLLPLVLGDGMRTKILSDRGEEDLRTAARAWNHQHRLVSAAIACSPMVGVLAFAAVGDLSNVRAWLIMMSLPAMVHFTIGRRGHEGEVDESLVFENQPLVSRVRRTWRHPSLGPLRPMLVIGAASAVVAGSIKSMVVSFVAAGAVIGGLQAVSNWLASGRLEPTAAARRAGWEAEHRGQAAALEASPGVALAVFALVTLGPVKMLLFMPALFIIFGLPVLFWVLDLRRDRRRSDATFGSMVEEG